MAGAYICTLPVKSKLRNTIIAGFIATYAMLAVGLARGRRGRSSDVAATYIVGSQSPVTLVKFADFLT